MSKKNNFINVRVQAHNHNVYIITRRIVSTFKGNKSRVNPRPRWGEKWHQIWGFRHFYVQTVLIWDGITRQRKDVSDIQKKHHAQFLMLF